MLFKPNKKFEQLEEVNTNGNNNLAPSKAPMGNSTKGDKRGQNLSVNATNPRSQSPARRRSMLETNLSFIDSDQNKSINADPTKKGLETRLSGGLSPRKNEATPVPATVAYPTAPSNRISGENKHRQFATHFKNSLRDVSDLLAPNYMEIREHFVRIGDTYFIYLYIPNLPRRLRPGWLDAVNKANIPHEVDYFIEPQDSREAIDNLLRRQKDLTATKMQNRQKGRLNSPELELALDDIPSFVSKLETGADRVIQFAILISTWATSPAKVRDQAMQISAIATRCGADVRRLVLQQEKGLRSNLPDGQRYMRSSKTVDATSVAFTYPFASTALNMEGGVFWGLNQYENSPVVVNLWGRPEIKNPNLGIIASSGGGKSFLLKILAMRHLFNGIKVTIGDPENEYGTLAAAAGGRNLSLSASSSIGFNLFELPSTLDGSLSIYENDDEGGEGEDFSSAENISGVSALAGNTSSKNELEKGDIAGKKSKVVEKSSIDVTATYTTAKAKTPNLDPLSEKTATLIPILCMMIEGADNTSGGTPQQAGPAKTNSVISIMGRHTRDKLAKAVFEAYKRCGITREIIAKGHLNARDINRNTIEYAALLKKCGGPANNREVAQKFQQLAVAKAEPTIPENERIEVKRPRTPSLADLRDTLYDMDTNDQDGLALAIDRYVTGEFAGFFTNLPTEVTNDDYLTVFAMRELPEELQPIVVAIMIDWCWQRAVRFQQPAMFIFDELWKLISSPAGADLAARVARRSRKNFLAFCWATQQLDDVTSTLQGRAIINSTATKWIGPHEENNRKILKETLDLNEEQVNYLTKYAKTGQGLLKCGNNWVTLTVEHSEFEYNIAQTSEQKTVV